MTGWRRALLQYAAHTAGRTGLEGEESGQVPVGFHVDTVGSVAGGMEKRRLEPDIILKQVFINQGGTQGSVTFYGKNITSLFSLFSY